MRKWTLFFLSLVFIASSFITPASYAKDKLMSASFNSVKVYYGQATQHLAGMTFYVSVLTPNEVAYGSYNSATYKGSEARLLSWTGSGPAPVLILDDFGPVSNAFCPGIDTAWYRCAFMTFKVTVQSDDYGCPWISSYYAITTERWTTAYTGPTAHATVCPTIPVASYDISWNESSVSKSKLLQLKSTGTIITTTLSTYLMEDGKLCDGSVFDPRGAYCRVVSELLTFTSYGCDESTVTVTPTRHPVTDKQLHDIVVKVNTSSRQPIDSTCRFQYVLNEL
ncbi:DUF2544 domain-containing protein [Escherichia coli]|nr:DUF2544 domain-containing protein [Escherichia coli]